MQHYVGLDVSVKGTSVGRPMAAGNIGGERGQSNLQCGMLRRPRPARFGVKADLQAPEHGLANLLRG
jgi:hypothetical protein